MRSAAAIAAVVCALVGDATDAAAHDFWLVPNAFRVAAGEQVEVRGQTSSRFPTSEAAVAVGRVADARLLSAAASHTITDLSVSGNSLILRHRLLGAGQSVVAVTLRPVSVRASAADFRRYLELEGAPQALVRVDREGLLAGRDSVTRRYAKYAKTIVEVGSGGARSYSLAAGHPLEFIPAADPSVLGAGDTLLVRLLYRGRPLEGARLHAGFVPAPGGQVQLNAVAPVADLHLVTDSEGLVRVPVMHAGVWNVRALYVVESDANSGADWDTHWATLVFVVPEANAGASGTAAIRSDSADVAAVVDRYHQALVTGDSVAALALLTDDAVILESGGVETRAEYRSHHLPGDIAFSRAVKSERGPVKVTVKGDVAWASSTSTAQGEFNGRAINSAGAELMVLVRTAEGWKIAAIHWSARRRQ